MAYQSEKAIVLYYFLTRVIFMVAKMLLVNKIGPMSLGKLLGLMYAIFGLIIGALMSLISMGNMMYGGFGARIMMFGIGAVIAFPIFYGIMGFISGILIGLFYNFISGFTGGLEMEVEMEP